MTNITTLNLSQNLSPQKDIAVTPTDSGRMVTVAVPGQELLSNDMEAVSKEENSWKTAS